MPTARLRSMYQLREMLVRELAGRREPNIILRAFEMIRTTHELRNQYDEVVTLYHGNRRYANSRIAQYVRDICGMCATGRRCLVRDKKALIKSYSELRPL